jgi:outer membrane protein OmpA-like peptidoglycan-associated protein
MTRAIRSAAILTTSLLALSIAIPAAAQPVGATVSRSQIGIYGAYQLVQHSATLAGIPGVPTCCNGFDGGTGSGFAIGALYQLPLARVLALQFRAGYSLLGGSLTTSETIGNAMENGNVVDATVEHRIEPTLGLVGIEPMLSWYPLDFPLAINVGVQGDLFMVKKYKQSETLITPKSATFTNGRAVRNEAEGDIEQTRLADRLYVAGIIGLSYDIPLSKDFTLAPEVAYHYGFTSIIPDSAWKAHALRFGVSLKMGLGEPSSVTPTSKPALAAMVRATGLFADSSEQPIVQIRVEEFLGTQLRPLLNYVFFDNSSSTLPDRYVRLSPDQTRAFSVENLHYMDAIQTYHQVLNIIGRRMQQNPAATIRLVGTNSDEGSEKGNSGLSQQRAETVRNYLRDNWGIAESRMKIEARGLPDKPSNIAEPDGIAENRRVEIYSDEWKIVEPVLTSDTVRSATPPGIRFRTSAQSEAGLGSWRLTAGQSGQTLKEFSGTGAIPAMLDWHLEEDQTRVPRIPIPIDYQLEVTDVTGQTFAVPAGTIPTDQVTIQRKRRERVADKEINRFSLILFDFAKSDLNDANRRIVDYIKNRITLDANVSVTGTTDRLGDAEFNRKLSQDRATVTAQALGVPVANAKGAGETLLYDNNLPEGRFYSRTVNVVVETPVVE